MDRRSFLLGATTATMTLPAVAAASEAKSYATVDELKSYLDRAVLNIPVNLAQTILHAANRDGITNRHFHDIAQSQHSYEIYGKESRRIRQMLKVDTATPPQPKISSYDPEGRLTVVFYDYWDRDGAARRLSISYEYVEGRWSMGWVSNKPMGVSI